MNYNITSDYKLYFNNFYPLNKYKKSNKKFNVILSFGSNIGNSFKILKKVFNHFNNHSLFDIIKTSPILKNPPFGFLNQPYFYNSLIQLKTNIYPQELLKQILRIEKKFGRIRTFKNAPRTIDIDIIFFETKIVYNHKLTIPHREWFRRENILINMLFL